jgi:hypothetical protein
MAQKHAEVPTVRRAAGRGEGGAHERQQVAQFSTGGAVASARESGATERGGLPVKAAWGVGAEPRVNQILVMY